MDPDVEVIRAQLREARQEARQARFERDELARHIKTLNKTVGKQGETIARTRAELARTREENSKIERGQLRWLERQVEILRQQTNLDAERLVKRTQERNEALARAERAESLEIAEEGEYQHFDGSWHPFQIDRWRPAERSDGGRHPVMPGSKDDQPVEAGV